MTQTAMTIDQPRDLVAEPQTAAITPMDMLNTALSRGADMSVLEKLMGLQERWEANQARKAFDSAISLAKAEIGPVARNAEGHNRKRYADFAAIARAVDPILSKHGLSYRFRTEQSDKAISVTCVLSHREGHSEPNTLSGPADTSGNKNAIQAIGSTLTYLQRYSLMQALGLAASDDDDGRAVSSGEMLSEDQLKTIRAALRFNDRTEEQFCKFKKVERLEDIPARDFAASLNAIKGARN